MSAARSKPGAAQVSEGLPDAGLAISQVAPQAAPRLSFKNAAGKSLSLLDYRASGLVVNIWATWCGPCVAELPSFAAIAGTLRQSRILVLPISVDLDGAKAVSPFYASHNIKDLPVLLDPQGTTTNALNAQGIPVTIIVNPEGQLVGRLDGGANWNTAATLAILRQLAGPKPDGSDVQPA